MGANQPRNPYSEAGSPRWSAGIPIPVLSAWDDLVMKFGWLFGMWYNVTRLGIHSRTSQIGSAWAMVGLEP